MCAAIIASLLAVSLSLLLFHVLVLEGQGGVVVGVFVGRVVDVLYQKN